MLLHSCLPFGGDPYVQFRHSGEETSRHLTYEYLLVAFEIRKRGCHLLDNHEAQDQWSTSHEISLQPSDDDAAGSCSFIPAAPGPRSSEPPVQIPFHFCSSHLILYTNLFQDKQKPFSHSLTTHSFAHCIQYQSSNTVSQTKHRFHVAYVDP